MSGEFLHLALVPNPRYERANIVMNAKDEEKEEPKEPVDLYKTVFNTMIEVISDRLGE